MMTIQGAVLLLFALGLGLIAWAQQRELTQGEARRADTIFEMLNHAQARHDAEERVLRARVEVLERLLDQYRAEGIRKETYIDYGPPTPAEPEVDLAPEVEAFLMGITDDEARSEWAQHAYEMTAARKSPQAIISSMGGPPLADVELAVMDEPVGS